MTTKKEGGKTNDYECITIEKISFIDAHDPKQKHIWYVKDSTYIDLINTSCIFEFWYSNADSYFTTNIQIILQWIFRLFCNENSDYFTMNIQIKSMMCLYPYTVIPVLLITG